MSPEMLTVKELKAKLTALGAPTDGSSRFRARRPVERRVVGRERRRRARAGESRAVEHVADLHPTRRARRAGRGAVIPARWS